jgi:hypothetical protein
MNNTTQTELAIYNAAKSSLGKPMTLDLSIPINVRCAEAVSAILKLAGINDGPQGIAGTDELETWLRNNPKFEQIAEPECGAIVISATEGSQHGHTGIVAAAGAEGNGITGIMSNNSETGLFLELWNTGTWKQYFVDVLHLEMNFYRAL